MSVETRLFKLFYSRKEREEEDENNSRETDKIGEHCHQILKQCNEEKEGMEDGGGNTTREDPSGQALAAVETCLYSRTLHK